MRAHFRKELLEGIYGYKFVLSMVLSLTVIPFTLFLGAERNELEATEYRLSTERAWEAVTTQPPKPPHSAAHVGISIWKHPTPLVAFSTGSLNELGVSTTINPHQTPRLSGSLSERTPLLNLFGKLDYAIVIQVIFGLFAFVLSFDLVSGEREDGTLKLVLAHSVSRSEVLVGKALGGSTVLLIPVTLATLLSLFFFTPIMGVSLTGTHWLQVLGVFLLSCLFLVMMFVLGLLVSCLTRRRMTSMIVLLVVWVTLIFVVPRAATSIAQHLVTLPSSEEVSRRIREASAEAFEKNMQVINEWLAENPGLTQSDVPPSVQVAGRRAMDQYNESQEARIRQNVDVALQRQVSLATSLARISPATSYMLAVTHLSGTGVHRHQRFLRHLDEYRHRFAEHFNRMEDDDIQLVEDFTGVPRFEYAEEPLANLLLTVMVDASIMATLCVLLFGAAFAAFVRYDVR
ncbi:MAG TPA: ABC transporter permease subunit [Thermoanaerobaculia bacterium]|nr:ABC transporter permease subunit [Thermoanaerobaculia bacterium]